MLSLSEAKLHWIGAPKCNLGARVEVSRPDGLDGKLVAHATDLPISL